MPIPLIFFIVIPIAELLLILKVADLIGGWTTLLLVILTAFIGLTVLKRQGARTMNRAQSRLQSGQLPAQEVVEGMMLVFAGAMLISPGFITDTIGVILLMAPLRRRLAGKLMRSGKGMFFSSVPGFGAAAAYGRYRSGPGAARGTVVEGEVIDEQRPQLDETRPSAPSSGDGPAGRDRS